MNLLQKIKYVYGSGPMNSIYIKKYTKVLIGLLFGNANLLVVIIFFVQKWHLKKNCSN